MFFTFDNWLDKTNDWLIQLLLRCGFHSNICINFAFKMFDPLVNLMSHSLDCDLLDQTHIWSDDWLI